jgi:hypothetical protein
MLIGLQLGSVMHGGSHPRHLLRVPEYSGCDRCPDLKCEPERYANWGCCFDCYFGCDLALYPLRLCLP